MDAERLSSADSTTSPEVIDTAFLILRERDRRFACYFLLEHETATLAELADVVAGWLHTNAGRVVEPQCRNRCYLRLRDVHVPKLVDAGIVRYDEEADRLSLAPCPEPIRELTARACAAETGS